jgi:endoglucanase
MLWLALAASLIRFLDPYVCAYQTDDSAEGAAIASEPGYWPVPNGLVDPLAHDPKPRVIHTAFRVSETPYDGYSPSVPSPLFKVNQVGYLPWAPKFAYLGAWLGPSLGAWQAKTMMTRWQLVDASTGDVVYESSEPPRIRVLDGTTKEGVPFTGEVTYEMDFSSVTKEGTYFVRVPRVGRSEDFRISSSAAEEAFRVHMGGLYQKRCGIAKTEPFTRWTSGACHTDVVRSVFAPEEGELSPKTKWFDIIRDNTDWEHGERLHVSGGWHDAADYDRRPMHLNIVNDLCAVYLMRPQNFADGQLSIPEQRNGIPDILDEAEWGLRHLLAVQQPDGGVGTWIETTGHPGPGNVAERDQMRYAVSRATRASSLAYAAHAALLARCHPAFREKYLESAKRAWNFAMSAKPATDIFEVKRRHKRFFTRREAVVWTERRDLPADALVKAAVNLAALTGDDGYLSSVRLRQTELADSLARDGWRSIPLYFAGERALGYPQDLVPLFARWEKGRLNAAKGALEQMQSSYAYRAPWYAPQKQWVHTMGLGHSHPLVRAQLFVLAHFITGDESYLEAASLANDFHNGCNPQGFTLTSGLGRTYPVAFLDLPSYSDAVAEYVPGITPYRWTYALPQRAVDMVWGGDRKRASAWPIWRRFPNLEAQTVAASEYTVWETIAPAASVTGYLLAPSNEPPPPPRSPAPDIRELPGYWPLP